MQGGNDSPGSRVRPRRASTYKQQLNLGGFKLRLPRDWRRLVAWGLLAAILIDGGTFGYILWTLRDMPDPGRRPSFTNSLTIYDRNGKVIDQIQNTGAFYEGLTLQQMGRWGPIATLAAEDRGYYGHGPIDYLAVARAAGRDLLRHRYAEGASTITEQVVNVSVNQSQHRESVFWKMQEAVLATGLEQKYSKNQILEMYLNRVPYGHNAIGLGAATKVFFGQDKQASDLDPAQAAFLAGIINGPGYFDPVLHYDRARQRQLYVLDGMVKMHVLTQQQADQAAKEDIQSQLKVHPLTHGSVIAPHFVDYVVGQLEKQFGTSVLEQGSLKVYTTLDLGLQQMANEAVQRGVARLKGYGVNNGTLLAADPQTGAILAWVGSADYNSDAISGQFDYVSDGHRQPGSSFKPYVYEAALKDRKITLASVLSDAPYRYPDGTPVVNWEGGYQGNISVRQALVRSRNVPAVKIGQSEGMDNVINLAHQMGIKSNLQNVPSTAIGASEITMMDNVQGYQVFADQGKKMPLMSIARVVDDAGNAVYQQQPGQQAGQAQVLTPGESYLITDVLRGYNDQWGLGWQRTMAGKSGTTGGAQAGQHPDAWMMAYNPRIVIGTWAANTGPNGHPMSAFGTNVGETIAAQFINSLPDTYKGWYNPPSDLIRGSGCPGGETGSEWFLPGTEHGAACPPPPGRNGHEGGNGQGGNGKHGGGGGGGQGD